MERALPVCSQSVGRRMHPVSHETSVIKALFSVGARCCGNQEVGVFEAWEEEWSRAAEWAGGGH